jgi:hypothetical protein
MPRTNAQATVYDYCVKNDFVSPEMVERFRQMLEPENNLTTLSWALEDFVDEACPNCQAAGKYRFHFMGKLNHSQCGWSWFLGPGSYSAIQIGKVFRTGMELGAGTASKAEEDRGGCLSQFFGMIFGFILGVIVRLPFALLMIPVQALFSLSQPKPQTK